MRILSLFGLCVLIAFASCKKSTPSSPNNSDSTITTPLLSQLIILDTTQPAPADTSEIISFKYDNSKRLVTTTDMVYNSGVPDIMPADITNYYYSGSDSIPSKSVDVEWFYENGVGSTIEYDTDTDYYSIANGNYEDSTISTFTENNVTTISSVIAEINSKNGSTVYSTEINYLPNFDTFSDTVTQITVNGDVTSQSDITVMGGLDWTFSFDTHPNPLYVSMNGLPVIYDIESALDGPQKNNYTEVIEKQADSTMYHVKNQYTYLSNSYPATAVEYDYSYSNSNNPIFNGKAIYVYEQ